jgi:ceramide glucosyltransferase
MMILFLIPAIIFCSLWVVPLIFVKLHSAWSDEPQKDNADGADLKISFIHPMKGRDYELKHNIESWVNQSCKGKIQHIFSFQEENDPAIKIAGEIKKKYPDSDIEIVINPVTGGLSGKSSNIANGLKLARYDLILAADSDIRVKPDFAVKMASFFKDDRVGAVSCGQMSIGGKDFLTRFFTYFQNDGTNFIWAFCTRIGMNVGMSGAAFAVKREIIEAIGGFEKPGSTLLEDYYLGKAIFRNGYKIAVGPFVECRIDRASSEELSSYAKRCAVGMVNGDPITTIELIFFLGWYWMFLAAAIILRSKILIIASIIFIVIRILVGLLQRHLTKDKVLLKDVIIPLASDLYEIFSFFYAFFCPYISWRGVRYRIGKGGIIRPD